MTVKNLLNYIAIEIEAGRLSEDAEVEIFDWDSMNDGARRKVIALDIFEGALDIETGE